MTFDEWYKMNVLQKLDDMTYYAKLKQAWDAAQQALDDLNGVD